MKNIITIATIATSMSNLFGRHFGQWFSSKELTTILKGLGIVAGRQALEDLENHGVVEFRNSRSCRFSVDREWLTAENLEKVIG